MKITEAERFLRVRVSRRMKMLLVKINMEASG